MQSKKIPEKKLIEQMTKTNSTIYIDDRIKSTKREVIKLTNKLTDANTRLHGLRNLRIRYLYSNPTELIKLLSELSKYQISELQEKPSVIMRLDFDKSKITQEHIDLLSKKIKFYDQNSIIVVSSHPSSLMESYVLTKYHLTWLCTAVYECPADMQEKMLKEYGSLKTYANVCICICFNEAFPTTWENFRGSENVRKYMQMHTFAYIFQNGYCGQC